MNTGELCFVLFYFVLVFYTISSLIIFAKDFFSRFSPIYHAILYSTLIISLYLLLTLRKKPGKVEKSVSNLTTLENNFTNPTKEEKEKINSTISERDPNTSQNIYLKDEFEFSQLCAELNSYCKICENIIPLRGKHCKTCGFCVKKFDHHCGMVGGCIGERNHLGFYIYVTTQSITLLLTIYAILDTISFHLDENKEKYSKVPLILYILLVILVGYFLLTTILFFFHSYLILTNQTTYEVMHRNTLFYLNRFKELKKRKLENLNIKVSGAMPMNAFDQGIKENIRNIYYNDVQ